LSIVDSIGDRRRAAAGAWPPLFRRPPSRCPELDCLRHRFPPDIIAAAERRALALNVGADRVLIAAQAITEDAYVVALAAFLRVPYEPLDRLPRHACPLGDADLFDADRNGLLPLRHDGDDVCVIAPIGFVARRLMTGSYPIARETMRLTSARRLRRRSWRSAPRMGCARPSRSCRPHRTAAARTRGG
jgi:hypothetical protein